MELFPVLLAFACLGGVILFILLSFCVTITGSISPDGWSAGGGLGPIIIILLPKRTLELRLFGRTVYTYIIPEEAEDSPDEIEDEKREILKEAEKKTRFPFSQLLKMPVSIDSIILSGRIGTGDAGETAKLYGWIAALRGALRTTRIHLNVTPDFAEAGWSASIKARIRIRSLFHLVSTLVPFVRR